MKIRVHNPSPDVQYRAEERRSVVITIAGIEMALTPVEAVHLANDLVDAAERGER